MATEYISREAAIEALCKAHSPYPRRREISVRAIQEIPAADVRPVVSGSWIEATDYNGDTYYICPACEDEFVLTDGTLAGNHYFFCPNCGADLRKVVEIDQVKK